MNNLGRIFWAIIAVLTGICSIGWLIAADYYDLPVLVVVALMFFGQSVASVCFAGGLDD